jgi:hypothetical protein
MRVKINEQHKIMSLQELKGIISGARPRPKIYGIIHGKNAGF